MRPRKLIPVMALLAGAHLLVAGCEGERGPVGASGTAECMSCHTDDFTMANFILPIETEFAESQHATGDTYVRRGSTNSPECSRCHTNEGHQIYLNTGSEAAVAQSSRIGCFTCHAPHTRMDFTLRKIGSTVLDRGGTYDKGNSNACAVCHQARVPGPNFGDGVEITSKYWGPHHGPQASILSGSGAYEFGSTYDTAHPHNDLISDGCVQCHMGPLAPDGLAGGHSYKIRYEYHGAESVNGGACRECHLSWTTDSQATSAVNGTQSTFQSDLDALAADMVTLGWLDADHYIVPATYDAGELGAVYNFIMLTDDRSGSVHNPTYANDVLASTQAFVDAALAEARREWAVLR